MSKKLATLVASMIAMAVPLGAVAPLPAHAAETCVPPAGPVKVCVDAGRDESDDAYVDATISQPGGEVAEAHVKTGVDDTGNPFVSGLVFAPDSEHGVGFNAFTKESAEGDPAVEVAVNLVTDYKVNATVTITPNDPLAQQQLCLSNDQSLLPPKICLLPIE